MSIMNKFRTEEAARNYFESVRWSDGVECPHCGSSKAYAITPNIAKKIRPGLYQCGDCKKTFTVTVGTVMEDSHIPLNKWLIGFYMMCASKTQVSALQLQRQLEIGSYSTALFMCHRIRYALSQILPDDKLKGEVEIDETYIGGKVKGKGQGYTKNKTAVVSVVERGGNVVSTVVDSVTGKVIGKLLDEKVDESAHLNTDEAQVYVTPGKKFASHDTVKHADEEYAYWDPVTGRKVTTNAVEGFFGNSKRSISGTHHNISPWHTDLYFSELDYKYNTRDMTDGERTKNAIPLIEGKRLKKKEMYNRRFEMNQESESQPIGKAVSNDEFRMSASKFNRIIRRVLTTPIKEDVKRMPFLLLNKKG
jgi:transposase-like protein